MKNFIFALLLVLIHAISTEAAVVHLKSGGQVKAIKVWREKGMVVVLLNHESITSFSTNEINLRKTFPHRKKAAKPAAPSTTSAPARPANDVAAKPVVNPPPDKAGKKISLPKISTKLPEREPPKVGEGGAIRKQKKEMEQRLNE